MFWGSLLTLLLPLLADIKPDRISILLGSHHFDAKMDFEEVNPGVFATWGRTTVGVYHNSFGRVSESLTYAVPLTPSLSLFGGIAHYPQEGRYFAVHIGDVAPLFGLQYQKGNFFAQVIPSDGKVTTAIVAVGLTFRIKP